MTGKPPSLSELALRLRNANPDVFSQFVATFNQYYEDLTFKVVQAPSDEVLQAQGRAQTAFALLRLFKECTLEKKVEPLPAVRS